jgi:16S rRNA (cytosine967-C5)-methyltransferase
LKLHKNLCEAVINGLEQVFVNGEHANQAIETLLQSNKKWGARDRHFIAEHTYNIIRYYRLYCHAAGLSGIHSRMDAWSVLGSYFNSMDVALPDWVEWESIDTPAVLTRLAEGKKERAIRESIPDWLDQRAAKEIGTTWDEELKALNGTAPLCIRVNTLKATKQSVIDFLKTEDIAYRTVDNAPLALVIEGKKNLRNTFAYKGGWFEIQDISSQLVAAALDLKPGLKVIDACSGAGGKALHIAALMGNKGEILAMDLYQEKLTELEKRSKRNGTSIIKPILIADQTIEHYQNYADRLLLDVPCSGLGVLRRNPDAKWKLMEEGIEELLRTQTEILDEYSSMLKKGGILVYATCSILPSENERQIAAFTAKHPEFEIIAEQKIAAHTSGFDGFYICSLKKNS